MHCICLSRNLSYPLFPHTHMPAHPPSSPAPFPHRYTPAELAWFNALTPVLEDNTPDPQPSQGTGKGKGKGKGAAAAAAPVPEAPAAGAEGEAGPQGFQPGPVPSLDTLITTARPKQVKAQAAGRRWYYAAGCHCFIVIQNRDRLSLYCTQCYVLPSTSSSTLRTHLSSKTDSPTSYTPPP